MAVTKELRERFQNLFVGGNHAHGVWNPDTGDSKTVREAPTDVDYADHIEGKMGLGLVPVTTEGTCRFAALDIDVDTIDHQQLAKRIADRKLPLTVCRSKSGGAHLYLFLSEPLKAGVVIIALKKWATALGYQKSEIFPKQARATKSNIGNWINLPYFAAKNTVRYAVLETGAQTFEEFLSTVKFWDGKDLGDVKPNATLVQIEQQFPPCLGKLTSGGVLEGARNQVLFNLGVFARKSNPTGYEDMLVGFNGQYMARPLPNRELQAIIKSVAQRKYQYTCDQEPLCSNCDRPACLKLPFGVGHEPWKSELQYAELRVSNCRKILTSPPMWIVEVNAVDIDLTTDELMMFTAFQKRVFESTNMLVYPQKKDGWDRQIIELMEKVIEIEAPEDASEDGMILDKVQDFLSLIDRSTMREDILLGLPIDTEDTISFRVSDLQKFLKAQLIRVPNEDLYKILHRQNCNYAVIRVKGKVLRAWTFPKNKMNQQTEEFTPPKLPVEESDL